MLNTTVYFQDEHMKRVLAYDGENLHKNLLDVQAHLNTYNDTKMITVRKDDKHISILARDGVKRDVTLLTNNYKTRVYTTRRVCAKGFSQCSPTAIYKVKTLSEMSGLKSWASREISRRLNKALDALDRLDAGDAIAEAVANG